MDRQEIHRILFQKYIEFFPLSPEIHKKNFYVFPDATPLQEIHRNLRNSKYIECLL